MALVKYFLFEQFAKRRLLLAFTLAISLTACSTLQPATPALVVPSQTVSTQPAILQTRTSESQFIEIKAGGFSLAVQADLEFDTDASSISISDKRGGLIISLNENHVRISFSPQSVNNFPRYELVTSPAYRAFIEKVIQLKKQGAPILGSFSYFKTLLDQTPYECYPALVPRILPDGWLAYLCRPMEKAGGEQGGRAVNLLQVNTWEEAWKIAIEKYGDAPTSCVSCFQQCYAEPSLMQAHPFEYLFEKVRGSDAVPMHRGKHDTNHRDTEPQRKTPWLRVSVVKVLR